MDCLRAGDLNLERLVHRLHGVSHVDTGGCARDLPSLVVLLGLGFTLTGAGLVAKSHTVDIAKTDRLHRLAVFTHHSSDTRGRIADRDVHVPAHRTAHN